MWNSQAKLETKIFDSIESEINQVIKIMLYLLIQFELN